MSRAACSVDGARTPFLMARRAPGPFAPLTRIIDRELAVFDPALTGLKPGFGPVRVSTRHIRRSADQPAASRPAPA